ncbi:threonine--tRNA ligase [archaeon]|nr:threonine--tRNA ligase [archaeon]
MANDNLEKLRHSSAHLLAQAIKSLYPKVKLGVGPVIENGFYYDFDNLEIKESDFNKIENKMRGIIKRNYKFVKSKKQRKAAEKILKDEPYKLELLKGLKNNDITFYQDGDFVDLCKGPHVNSSKDVKFFKLTKIAGAYWKGDSKNKMLTRIYGTAFHNENELKDYLKLEAEAEEKNHVNLGKRLGLFVIDETIGKGLPLLTPKGTTIRRVLERFIQDEEIKRGYQYTRTPVLAKSDLYKISGHIDHFRDDMFIFDANGEEFALRPMTCPHQFMIYKSELRSYRDLPIKYAEIADLFRNEKTGELHGLIRVRQFSLADAHIFCRDDQVEKEFENVLDLIQYVMKTLGFKDYWYRFSKWDPKDKKKYVNNPKAWKNTQKIMKNIVDKLKLKYVEADGEAAFYGPKLDIQMRNVFGKEDTVFTVQIDFALPEKFELTYEGEDGKKHRPIVIHRSSIGCLERTIAMLIEHTGGNFPLWLSPTQIRILTINDKNIKFANEVLDKLSEEGLRVELNDRNESIPKKVRDAQVEKIPIVITIGDKEQKNKKLAVRTLNGKVKFNVNINKLATIVKENIENKNAKFSI